MDNMDMDIDFDMDQDPEILRLQAEADAINKRAEEAKIEAMHGIEQAEEEEGEVDENAPAPHKVHVRGLEELNTNHIQDWVRENGAGDFFEKVQWVNDTSANLVYESQEAAAHALQVLSTVQADDPLQLRQARGLFSQPQASLAVRQALQSDVKVQGAKDSSRFYLFHPEWEPENRKRKRVYDDSNRYRYRKRDYDDEDQIQRRGSRGSAFHEDMYGDDAQASNKSRRRSESSAPDLRRRRVAYDDRDVMNSRQNDGRLRNRSLSPARDGDGRYGFSDENPRRSTARPRAATPPRERHGRSGRDDGAKELFPGRKGSAALNGHDAASSAHLGARRTSSAYGSRELFPDKVHSPSHRRKDAKDLDYEHVTHAIGQYNLDSSNQYVTYRVPARPNDPSQANGRSNKGDLFSRIDNPTASKGDLFSRIDNPAASKGDLFPRTSNNGAPASNKGDLFSRISKPTASVRLDPSFGRLRADDDLDEAGIRIRGAADHALASQDAGLSIKGSSGKADEYSFLGAGGKAGNGDDFRIRGASKVGGEEPDSGYAFLGAGARPERQGKELFPRKAGGEAPRELFGEGGVRGRGGAKRRRAEDLFG